MKDRGPDFLSVMRARLAREGLHIVLPLGQTAFDFVCAGVGIPSLATLLPGAAGAVLVGDGGSSFFSLFRAARSAGGGDPDPLDQYTRGRVAEAVRSAVLDHEGESQLTTTFRILYPFVNERPVLPFQRLGHAAGLPAPGPLGIQIHPVFGPWWAYRALIVVSASLQTGAAVTAPCVDCPQPCIPVCPGLAVSGTGFAPDRCIAHRRLDTSCRESCVARVRCPVGTAHGYPQDQLAFHMNASFAQIRR